MRMLMNVLKAEDATMSDELAAIEMQSGPWPRVGRFRPARVRLVLPRGLPQLWSARLPMQHGPPIDEYWREAVDKGWWEGAALPAPEMTPRVLLLDGSNPIRRTPSGQSQLLRHLWPKLKLIVTLELRMSASALHSDIVLPVAAHYEKQGFCIPTTHVPGIVFGDKVVDPPGEAKPEWEIIGLLLQKLEKRAKERGIVEYTDAWAGATAWKASTTHIR
jgi:anaerobic selenocysteine-containing dehydrogenase